MSTELLTYAEAAEQLRCTTKTIQRLVKAGHLTKVKLSESPRGARIASQSLRDYVAGFAKSA